MHNYRHAREGGHPENTSNNTSLWIPAFAGMTRDIAGMTGNIAGMTRDIAGMTLDIVGMTVVSHFQV